MATFTVTINEKQNHLADFHTIFNQTARPYLIAAMNIVKAGVIEFAPADLGIFRNSITTRIDEPDSTVATISGTCYSQDTPVKVAVIEGGRRHGVGLPVVMVPGIRKPLIKTNILYAGGWIKRKLGLTGQAALRAAFFIGLKISGVGIEGRFPFKKAEEQSKAECSQILDVDFPQALAAKL